MAEWKHLSYASSLCGNCTEVCAVKINLHELLLENRHDSVKEGHNPLGEKIIWKMWMRGMLNRRWMNLVGSGAKNWVVNTMLKGWKEHRSRMEFPKKSFNQRWKEKSADQ
jgi:L-lactate dehydrogenase complex protein LldF